MIKDDTLVAVRNRDNGSVGYTLDNNFHRTFEPNEVKKVPFSELKALSYTPGGQYELDNLLVIEDKEVLEALNMTVEPEYFYTPEQVHKVLFEGSMDEFADFLDFAPEGAIEIAKDFAIKEEIPDTRKRDMLSKKLGFNINNAIMVNKIMDDDIKDVEEEAPKQRRVALNNAKTEDKERRVAVSNYKVVSQS